VTHFSLLVNLPLCQPSLLYGSHGSGCFDGKSIRTIDRWTCRVFIRQCRWIYDFVGGYKDFCAMKPLIIRRPKTKTAAPMERRNNFIKTTRELAKSLNRQVLVANEKDKRT
jgi:hypothetical protein